MISGHDGGVGATQVPLVLEELGEIGLVFQERMHSVENLFFMLASCQARQLKSELVRHTVVMPFCNDAQLCHSVVCHDSSDEAARIASQFS